MEVAIPGLASSSTSVGAASTVVVPVNLGRTAPTKNIIYLDELSLKKGGQKKDTSSSKKMALVPKSPSRTHRLTDSSLALEPPSKK